VGIVLMLELLLVNQCKKIVHVVFSILFFLRYKLTHNI